MLANMMATESPKMESPLRRNRTHGRKPKGKNPVSDILFYNPDRWKRVSIGSNTVGPMGIFSLSAEQVRSPGVQNLMQHGQLARLPANDEQLQIGAMLLHRFDQAGRRGAIIVSRTYAHGDIFLAAMVVAPLVANYPDTTVIFHTTTRMEPFLRHYPHVEIITGDEALQKALRTAGAYLDLDDIPERYEEFCNHDINRIEIFCQYLGIEPQSLCPSYYILKEEIDAAGNYFEQYQRPYIAISPSTMRKEKTWRPENWKALAGRIVDKTGGTVFIFDGKDALGIKEKNIVPVINKGFRIAGALAYHMDIFVTHDSLWSHFAAALGVPQILLASCTDGALLSKGYPEVMLIQRDWDCSPCWYKFQSGCIYGNYPRCLDDVSVNEVLNSVVGRL